MYAPVEDCAKKVETVGERMLLLSDTFADSEPYYARIITVRWISVAISESDVDGVIDHGEPKLVEFANVSGALHFHCTVFCSSHHEEMQDTLLVEPTSDALNARIAGNGDPVHA